jgi:hypothetical protein
MDARHIDMQGRVRAGLVAMVIALAGLGWPLQGHAGEALGQDRSG